MGDHEQHLHGVPPLTKCARCLFHDCLCDEVPRIETRTRVVILRHVDEQRKASNTGRLAHFALPNSEIVDYPQPEGAPVPAMPPGAQLVFPGGPPSAVRPEAIVILDGTWAQARRMYRKIGALRGLPFFALPATIVPAAARFREAPSPDRVSTIEAIAAALGMLEGEACATPLLQLFEAACGRAAASGRRVVRSPTLVES